MADATDNKAAVALASQLSGDGLGIIKNMATDARVDAVAVVVVALLPEVVDDSNPDVPMSIATNCTENLAIGLIEQATEAILTGQVSSNVRVLQQPAQKVQ